MYDFLPTLAMGLRPRDQFVFSLPDEDVGYLWMSVYRVHRVGEMEYDRVEVEVMASLTFYQTSLRLDPLETAFRLQNQVSYERHYKDALALLHDGVDQLGRDVGELLDRVGPLEQWVYDF